ncbi:coiled-coil domain-containing protein 12 [Elephas maximus indicus]|nr:coiled-coil domain-containing protein 12 [Elephas maximus indicus]
MARPVSGVALRHLPPPPPPRRPPAARGQAHGRRASLRGGAARYYWGKSAARPPPGLLLLLLPASRCPASCTSRQRPPPPRLSRDSAKGGESIGRRSLRSGRLRRAPRSPAPTGVPGAVCRCLGDYDRGQEFRICSGLDPPRTQPACLKLPLFQGGTGRGVGGRVRGPCGDVHSPSTHSLWVCAVPASEEGGSAGKMAGTAAGVGRLEEEALRRKERLKALREKTGRKDKEDGEPKTKQLREEEEEGEKHRELRLRNYVPEDEDLKKRRVPQAKPVAVEEKVKEQLEAAKPEPIIEEVDLANLAPRKPDWDLKRDVAKKLEKLEKRTQRAIAELIRERLKGQEDSLASAVDATAEPEACDSD